jgi:hypothetical protein
MMPLEDCKDSGITIPKYRNTIVGMKPNEKTIPSKNAPLRPSARSPICFTAAEILNPKLTLAL